MNDPTADTAMARRLDALEAQAARLEQLVAEATALIESRAALEEPK